MHMTANTFITLKIH